jgi:hypothetical protein
MSKGTRKIQKGLSALSKAITEMEQGITANNEELESNARAIQALEEHNRLLGMESDKAFLVVNNFRKNILGE